MVALGLARLADENPHILMIDRRRILRDELRREHGDDRAPGQLRKINRADLCGVITRPTADEIQIARILHLLDQRFDFAIAVQDMR